MTPIAPAPTDEIVTNTPSTNPMSTVSMAIRRGDRRSSRPPDNAMNKRRKNSDIAVRTQHGSERTQEMTWLAGRPFKSNCEAITGLKDRCGQYTTGGQTANNCAS